MNIPKLFLLVLLVAGTAGARAQGISIGPRVGVNFASFSTDAVNNTPEGEAADKAYEDDRRALAGAMAGIMVNIPFSSSFSVQPELLFSAKGYKREGSLPAMPPLQPFAVPYEQKTILNYLELPLLLKASFGPENRKISLLAGPYVGYLAGGRVRHEENGQETYKEKLNFEYDDNHSTKFQRLDAGAVIGASGSYVAGSGIYMIDVRYNYGLTDNFEYRDPTPDAVKIYNRTFSVSFGYAYILGNKGAFKPKPMPDENM